jgi:hypothetical protein
VTLAVAVASSQTGRRVPVPPALAATHAQYVELTDKVAEDDCAVAGHLASRPATQPHDLGGVVVKFQRARHSERFFKLDYQCRE